jgi:hypothetical protein
MKIYEAFWLGTITAVPTPELHKTMIIQLKDDGNEFTARAQYSLLRMYPDKWHTYYDVYDPANKDCFVFFNTWDELKKLILGEIPIDKEKLRANMMQRSDE